MTTPAKVIFHTYSTSSAAYLAKGGAKVRLLFKQDDIDCFEVKIKGRPMKRLLETPEYAQLAAEAYALFATVAERRVRPPLYVVLEEGKFATLQDKDASKFVAVARTPDALTQTLHVQGSQIAELATSDDIEKFLADADKDGIPEVRFIIGYVDGLRIPLNESYPLKSLLALTNLVTPDAEQPAAPQADPA